MKYLINSLRFPVCLDYDLAVLLSTKLKVSQRDFRIHRILRQAVDTRKHDQPWYDFSLEVEFFTNPPKHQDVHELRIPKQILLQPKSLCDPSPVIAGMGPAGLFCALAMVERGFKPILIDRGDALEERAAKVDKYWQSAELDPDSNVQFGEGGAGAWSDGKLTSRSKDPLSEKVFQIMTGFGAPPQISYEALPHLGTDGIRALVKAIRAHLIEKGCEFRYRTRLDDVKIISGKLSEVKLNGEWIGARNLIIAPGNASRDSFRMLASRGVEMQAKSFAAGFRIEHSQDLIDLAVYGSSRWRALLGPATYRLTDRVTGTYSFCMCPGGAVVASASEPGTIVTNGMSFSARNAERCNAAIVCSVDENVYGKGLFAGMEWQEGVEKSAWKPDGFAPAMKAEDFVKGKLSAGALMGSYLPGIRQADLAALLPPSIVSRLRGGMLSFSKILKEFHRDAVLIAPETRTSSPLRFLRNPFTQSCVNISNLFIIGEGSGYAGGIVSSAIDGYRLGESFNLGSAD